MTETFAGASVRGPNDLAAVGREARRLAPRSSHGDWQPATDRPDPVTTLIDQAEGRVAELLPLRYGRMLVSPFSFYRGGAAIMARDLAGTPTSAFCRTTSTAPSATPAKPSRNRSVSARIKHGTRTTGGFCHFAAPLATGKGHMALLSEQRQSGRSTHAEN